jgi:glutamine amidotransferase
MSITVIDSGVANLASVSAALHRLGADAIVTSDAAAIRSATHVILPGVGAASAAMSLLEQKRLSDVIRNLTQPVLGICLGMQLMFTGSEEGKSGGEHVRCLNIIPGIVRRMIGSPSAPVPHMGWNQIKPIKTAHSLLKGVAPQSFVYFVHSYAAPVDHTTLATAEYNGIFSSVVAHKNFYGCQFHPERSSAVGSQILQNFLGL